MSKTHGQLTARELDLIHFGGLRTLAIRFASSADRKTARLFGRLSREMWASILNQPRP